MSELTLKIDPERIKEMPMVDLAFEVLKAANTPYYYRDLMMEIAKVRGLSQEQINQVIAQVYTEINIDGRFACVGSNMWGLKRWYPVDKSEDPISNAKRPRIINDDDDDDLYSDDEEETYTAEEEEFDLYDEDNEELFGENEEEAEVDEEVAIDDEEIEEEGIEGEELEEESEEEEDDFDSDDADSDDDDEDEK